MITKFNAIILVSIAILVLFVVYGQDVLTRVVNHQSSTPRDVRLGETVMVLPLAVLPFLAYYATKKNSRPFGILIIVIGSLMITSSVIFLLIRETPFAMGNTQGGISIPFLILLATGAYLIILGLRKIQR